MLIIHKDILQTLQQDYVKRIADGTLNLEELKGMFEIQVKLLDEYRSTITVLEQNVNELQEVFEVITREREHEKVACHRMKDYLESRQLIEDYGRFALRKDIEEKYSCFASNQGNQG